MPYQNQKSIIKKTIDISLIIIIQKVTKAIIFYQHLFLVVYKIYKPKLNPMVFLLILCS
jgi:hypothetical protein